MKTQAVLTPWSKWIPKEKAVLCFVVNEKEQKILMIFKKRGLGKDMYNGPGGRLEPGETHMQAVIRECQEELHITPLHLTNAGTIHFDFIDGYSLECEVFKGTAIEGTPTETEEATPHWFDIDKIPYDQMWEDDSYWLPELIKGRYFKGYFTVDKSKLLTGEMIYPREIHEMLSTKN
jgi:8-oxo-dGTP diphosphatase